MAKARLRLYDSVIEVLRVHHYSLRTERAYIGWIRRFILFHRPRHPRELSEADANRFLTHLAVNEHLHESAVSRAISAAVRRTDITKRVTAHTFRHSFATHLIEAGYDIRTVQELLGHIGVRMTMIYTHVLNRGGRGVRSPADFDDFVSE